MPVPLCPVGQAVFVKSRSMGFVIQIVAGKAPPRGFFNTA
jgi:hypothetical protein